MMFPFLLTKGAPRVFAALAYAPSLAARHLSIGCCSPR
jgi:hypothetical protein